MQPPDAYHHDGFYFRFTSGPAYTSFAGDGPGGSASISGFGSSGMLMVGGTPASGLVLAAALRSATIRDDFNGAPTEPEGNASATFIKLAGAVDWYPDARDGWHFGGLVGAAGLVVSDSQLPDSSAGGFAGGIMAGYDWWIGPEWSLGILLTGTATTKGRLRDEDGDETGYRFRALSVGLEASFSYH